MHFWLFIFLVPLLGSSRLALCLVTLMALLIMCLLEVSLSLSMVCMVRKPNSSDGIQPINDNLLKARDANMMTWLSQNTSDSQNGPSIDYDLSTESSTITDNLELVVSDSNE
jgi:hypothetical protein